MLKAKTYTEIMLREIINDLLRQPTVDKERYGQALQQMQAHLSKLDKDNPKAFISGLKLTPGLAAQAWDLIKQSAEQTLTRKLQETVQPEAAVTSIASTTANKAPALDQPISPDLPKPEW